MRLLGTEGDDTTRPLAGLWLSFVVFFAGAAFMAYEIVASRLLAPHFGNSTIVWGSLIGVFLSALAAGYSLGGRLADRRPAAGVFAAIIASGALLVLVSVLIADPVQGWIVKQNFGLRLNPLLASLILFAPASVLMGMVTPFALRLRAANIETVGTTAGALYGLSTFGSIAGTLAASFWLVQWLGSESTILLVAAVLSLCSLVAAVGGGARLVTRCIVVAPLVATVALMGAGVGMHESGSQVENSGNGYSPIFTEGGYRGDFQLPKSGTLRYGVDSPYHRIRVVDYPPQQIGGVTGDVRVMHFDNSLQSAVRLIDHKPVAKGEPVFAYMRPFELIPAIKPDAKRVLLIGLGAGTVAMRMHELRPDIRIDTVELDPEVVQAARKWFAYKDSTNGNPQIVTHVGDGRLWLAAQDTKFDAIIVDAYFSDSIPFHLATREFAQIVADHLTKGGIAAANLTGALEGANSGLARAMHATWMDVFEDSVLYPIPNFEGVIDLEKYMNIQILATRKRGTLPPRGAEAQLIQQADFAVPASQVLNARMQQILDARYTRQLKHNDVPVFTDDYAPIDRMLSVD